MQPDIISKKSTHTGNGGTPPPVAAEALENLEKSATDAVDSGRKAFNKAVDQVVPAAKHALENVEDSFDNVLEAANKMIRKHPLQSLLIGLGVGALIGAAFRGTKRAIEG